jgi:hypothetical protein
MIWRVWLYGPLIHSEEMADLLVMQHRIEAMRCEVENYAGQKTRRAKLMSKTSMIFCCSIGY